MTQREEEILHWIEENPLITQQELADLAGITRASVGVHISNLMKKGKIIGRGYVLPRRRYVTVIGGANIDISGTPFSEPNPHDSNPGRSTLSLGGVGRNIAENLSRLGVEVELITVLGDDSHARQIQENCRQVGMSLAHTLTLPGQRTSTYLCLNDQNGDMLLAVSDMEIYSHLTPQYLSGKLEVINGSSACVVDTNIPEETLRWLMDVCTVPLFLDPVSLKKTEKIKPFLHGLYAMKPNILEAQLLVDQPIRTEEEMAQAACRIHQMGVEQVFLSLGARGVYYHQGETGAILPCVLRPVVNTTGAGDSFLAAAVACFLEGGDIREMARWGLAASSLCVGSAETVSPQMSRSALLALLEEEARQPSL